MDHIKKQVRDAVIALLTGLPTTGARVYPAKRLPWQNNNNPLLSQMPGLAPYLDAETIAPVDKDGRERRDMVLIIDMAARNNDDLALDDTLLAMEAEVETALKSSPRLDGLLRENLTLLRVSPPPADAALGDAFMVRRHEYALSVEVMRNDPTQVAQ